MSNERDSDRLFDQNKDLYEKIHANTQRISELEKALGTIKTDLIGVSGQNGLRGEFRKAQEEAAGREKEIMQAISAVAEKQHTLAEKQQAMLKWVIALLLGVPGVVAAVLEIMGAL